MDKDLKKLASAYQQVLEAQMDPVDKAALKGKHKDRKDKDIDNDGDVDSSDEYLHKKRKAVSKAMKNEESELDEAMDRKKRFSSGAKAMKAYGQKYGGVDKKDFMEVSKLLDQIGRVDILDSGRLLTRLNSLIDGMDTDVRERMFVELRKVGLVEAVGLDEARDMSGMCCKNCGDKFGEPKTESCMYDAYNAEGKNWIKMENYKESVESEEKGMKMANRNTAKKTRKASKDKEGDVSTNASLDKGAASEQKESAIRSKLISVLEKKEKNPNASKAEKPEDALKGKGAKDMVDQPKDIDDTEEKGHIDAVKAAGVTKPAQARNGGDAVRSGDQKVVNAIAAAYKSMK